jgi:glycosyltransferase involved in cell wall biosynthesis
MPQHLKHCFVTGDQETDAMKFVVIVAMYNMEPWIAENIRMLQSQTYKNFHCLIGDDLSTDNSFKVASAAVGSDPRFEIVRHQVKKFSLGNIAALIEHANPADNDVLILVDGDDLLAHDRVLEKLAAVYAANNCLMTYGSYSETGLSVAPKYGPYPEWVKRLNCYRLVRWRASHLKTFKYVLWKHIPGQYFSIDSSELKRARRRALITGCFRTWMHWNQIERASLLSPCERYTRRCSDKAITYSLLELAGGRDSFIPDVLYHYRVGEWEHDFGNRKISQKWFARLTRNILRHKPRLQPIK